MRSSAWGSAWNAQRLAAGLALIAGYVDAYGLISYKTYLSFMSGNTTQTGSQLGQGHVALAIPSLIAIIFFVIGVFTGTLLAHSSSHHAPRLRFGLVAALMAAPIGLTQVGFSAAPEDIAILGFAMGVMNTMLSHVGAQSVNVGFVTGTLNAMANHLALAVTRAPLLDAQGAWDSHVHRALLLLGVWAAFITGALVAGLATPHYGVWVLLPPLLVLLALAVFSPAQRAMDDASSMGAA